MNVDRWLQILMGTLAALGTILLGMGQRNLTLPTLMLFVVVTSIVFTDILGWFRLHRTVANLAAVVAVVFSLSDFLQVDTQRQLLSIAHLLIYLQVILLYQRKSDRIYWQLVVLSLLQVVVAAALNVGFEFGVVLVVFSAVACFTLAVFFVQRTVHQFPNAAEDRPLETAPPASDDRQAMHRWLLGGPPRAEPRTHREDIRRELMGWGVARHVLGMGLATLVFTVVFFYCTPRTVSSEWQRRFGGGQVVGFSSEIELNELGKILQSNEQVMRVHFKDAMTNRPYEVFGEPYFRGMVLTNYASQGERSKWSNRQSPQSRPRSRLPTVPLVEGLVLQEVLLQPRSEALLFSVAPALRLRDRDVGRNVALEPRSGQLFRVEDDDLKLRIPFRYVVATNAFRDGVQRTFEFQYVSRRNPNGDRLRLADEKRRLLENFDPLYYPRLTAIAEEIVAKAPDGAETSLAKARLLQNHFLNTDLYHYTLDFRNLPRTPNLDPIEDFVANHHSGHCEYFASALTMMLRSQGIPARVVVGFKGGDLNQLGGYLQVRQKSAHAWVEAFIDRDDLPEAMLVDQDESLVGAWMRLDPTPSASAREGANDEDTLFGRFGQTLDYAQSLWDDYVLGLGPERQTIALNEELPEDDTQGAADSRQASTLRDGVRRMIGRFGLDIFHWRLRDWFSWRAGLLAMLLATAAIAAYRLVQEIWKRLPWRNKTTRRAQTRRRVRVEFYERLERLLEKVGLRRKPSQTQREFVLAVSRRLNVDGERTAASTALGLLVNSFYHVRFGTGALDKYESEAIEQALARLEEELDALAPLNQAKRQGATSS
jgi:transglutaminase-like putative cysteine protease